MSIGEERSLSSMSLRVVLGTCHHDCPDSCGWQVTVDDSTGRAVKLRGNPDHPYSKGELCPKVNRFLDRVYSPDRVLTPLRRTGAKGAGQFEPITWEVALAEIAERWRSIIVTDGAEAILPYSDAGTQGHIQMNSLDGRFFSALGASQLQRTICGTTVRAGVAATNGNAAGMDPEHLRFSKLIILWGTNTRLTNRHLWPTIEAARADGARIVVVDPIRTATAEAADWFIQPFPGTDAALMLAMMHILIRDGLLDREYIDAHTTGFAELADHVADWTPPRAAEVCGLPIETIEELAHAYATVTPAAIRVLVGPEHRENGAMFFRTLACLPLLTGAWRHRGGGLCRSVGTYAVPALAEVSTTTRRYPLTRTLNMGRLGDVLNSTTLTPPIRSLFVYNANPAVIVPDAELVRRGLERDDLFTVVHEQFLTDTALYADIVLPATTQIEQLDVVPAWGHLYLGWNEPAIAPVGESLANTEVFRRLAAAMGFDDPELYESDESLLAAAIPEAIYPLLRKQGWVRIPGTEDLRPFADGGFPTPTGKADLWGSRPPDFQPAAESPTGSSGLSARYPLVFLTTKSHARFLNSSYSQLPGHGDREGGPFVEIDAVDAAARGIADGEMVRVFNDRASLLVAAHVSTRLRPGVVSMPFGWWRSHHRDGVANSLTNAAPTDWGGGTAFHDTLVEIEASG